MVPSVEFCDLSNDALDDAFAARLSRVDLEGAAAPEPVASSLAGLIDKVTVAG
jgi:hypothetical protein